MNGFYLNFFCFFLQIAYLVTQMLSERRIELIVFSAVLVSNILVIFPGPALREDLIEITLRLGIGWKISVGMFTRQIGKII